MNNTDNILVEPKLEDTFFITDDIDTVTYEQLQMFLADRTSDKVKDVFIVLNSFGGCFYTSVEIVNLISTHRNLDIHTIGAGIVASSAFHIFLAGQFRYATSTARFMSHEVRDESSGGEFSPVDRRLPESKWCINQQTALIKRFSNLKSDHEIKEKFLAWEENFFSYHDLKKYDMVDYQVILNVR